MAPVSSSLGRLSRAKGVLLYLLERPSLYTRLLILLRVLSYVYEVYYKRPKQASAGDSTTGKDTRTKDKGKVTVDTAFLRRLWSLLRICIPGPFTKEMGMLVMHTGFLIARTWLSVVVANLDGLLVKTLVERDSNAFLRGLGMWFGIAIPATFTNSMIKYLQSKLAISFRTRLTDHIHQKYLESKTYYKIINLDSRIDNADQLITTDVNKFCEALAELYGNLGKPALDMWLFTRELEINMGGRGVGTLWWAYYATAYLMRAITPPFGKMRAEEAHLEGEFRFAHSRVITNAEEIAFYGGQDVELNTLNTRYLSLVKHINNIYRTRVWFNMFEDLLIKYAWTTIGLLAQALPVFFPDAVLLAEATKTLKDGETAATRTEKYVTNKRLMTSLADAGGRLMYSYKDLTELAGYTARVADMLEVFDDMSKSRYQKIMTNKEWDLNNLHGTVEAAKDMAIVFKSVPVISPNGDLLVKEINFKIAAGEHLMITGPNGSGKSSLVRILADLWPAFSGSIHKPMGYHDIFFVPQRPYLPIGSLRQQVIYPDTEEESRQKGFTDAKLMEILEATRLAYIPTREGGWETIKEWKDVFSGGEKQRVGMARVFYHKPRFAVLDECTSAVSVDVEGAMYAHAKDIGISLVTVSHRPSLFKYHQQLLRLDGQLGWSFEKLDTGKELLSISEEMHDLERKIAQIPTTRARLQEVNHQLHLNTK